MGIKSIFVIACLCVLLFSFLVEAQRDDAICSQPKVVGNCLAYMERYYYDNDEQRCKKFIYGGCGGNQNNFNTKQECKIMCYNL